MKEIQPLNISATPGDFGDEQGSVTLACGSSSSCCCVVFLGGAVGGIIGVIAGLLRGYTKGNKWGEDASSVKKFFMILTGMIAFGFLFLIIGLLLGAGIGICIDLIAGNL